MVGNSSQSRLSKSKNFFLMGDSELSLQKVLQLRQIQMHRIKSRAEYLQLYRKIVKKALTTELNELVNGEFNIVNVELDVPEILPQILGNQPTKEQEYTPMFQLDQIEDLYDASENCLDFL